MSELALDFGNLKGLRFRELCTTQTTTEVSQSINIKSTLNFQL